MTATATPTADAPKAPLSSRARVGFALGMLVLLLAPAAVVLLTRSSGPAVTPETGIRAGRLPADVAIQDSTVWVVSFGCERSSGRRTSACTAS